MFDAALHLKSETEDDDGKRHHSDLAALAYIFETDPVDAIVHDQTVVPESQVQKYARGGWKVVSRPNCSPQSDEKNTKHQDENTKHQDEKTRHQEVRVDSWFPKPEVNDVVDSWFPNPKANDTPEFWHITPLWKQLRALEFYEWEHNSDVLGYRHAVFIICWFVSLVSNPKHSNAGVSDWHL